jgi:hypothetical protein
MVREAEKECQGTGPQCRRELAVLQSDCRIQHMSLHDKELRFFFAGGGVSPRPAGVSKMQPPDSWLPFQPVNQGRQSHVEGDHSQLNKSRPMLF